MKKILLALLAPFLLAFDTPPAEYTKSATATIVFAPPRAVAEVCSKNVPQKEGYVAIACASQTGKGKGIVLMPNPCHPAFEDDFYAKLMCHEMAHLNGWKHGQ